MSYTETHFGKLKEVKHGYLLEDFFIIKLKEKGITKLKDFYDDWEDAFRDEFQDKYFIINDKVYETIEHIETDDSDIYHMQKNSDGTITFVMQFYNGGTCLSECIEEGLEKINNANNK